MAATLITVLAALDAPKLVVIILGAVATLAAGFLALGNWQQLWVRYRATAETLKHEKYLHRAQAGAYAQGGAGLLAERCEAVVSSEHSVWATAMEHVGGKQEAAQGAAP